MPKLHTLIPKLPSNIGKHGKLAVPPHGYVLHYTITDEIRRRESGMAEKILCLQRIEYDEDQRIQIRLGYYIIGKKPARKGRWVWGQYAALLNLKDFQYLVRKAEERGWIKPATII
jgi:hypothetical protein